jgi:hypothetical protein
VAEPSRLGETGRRWERWTDAAHRYLLPAASAASFGVAGALELGVPREVVAYTPWVLALLGTGALATSVGYHRWQAHVARLPERPNVRATPRRARPVSPRSDLDPAREWSDLVRRAWHTAVPPAHGGLSSPALVGDAIWSQWQNLAPDELPVTLVGPVPETAWFPTAPGGSPPFPQKEPGFIVRDGKLCELPRVETIAAPPDESSVSLILPGVGVSVGAPSGDAGWTSEDLFRSDLEPGVGSDGWPEFVGPLDQLTSEALHPVPPHLRISPVSGAIEPDPDPAPAPEPVREDFEPQPLCSSCSRAVPDEEQWAPCPECSEPVCRSCRTQAVVYYGHTWCASCAVGRAWDHPLVLEAPERFPGVFGPVADRFPSYGPGA